LFGVDAGGDGVGVVEALAGLVLEVEVGDQLGAGGGEGLMGRVAGGRGGFALPVFAEAVEGAHSATEALFAAEGGVVRGGD
jgi:hypothetical protein